MTIEYLKKAEKTAATGEGDPRKIVAEMLGAIEAGGEEKAIEYNQKLDNFTGNVVVTPEEIEAASAKVPRQVKDDIQFAYERVRGFAEKQREALIDFEVELSPGLFAGHHGGLLYPGWPLFPRRFRDHVRGNSQGCWS